MDDGSLTTGAAALPREKQRGLSRMDDGRIQGLLGPESPLSRGLPNYEYRESQLSMALAAARCFRDGGELLVEAGTGTGKTLAYLIPAVLSGQRVVVSTGTKNLQEQLYYKDIPLLRRLLMVPFSASLMKGRSNYLCIERFQRFQMQPRFRFLEEADHFDTLVKWAAQTKTGDRADVAGLPDYLEFWKGISARSENCIGRDCPDFDRCFVTKLRQRAAESELIVVNHHLLFADLIVREGGYGEVIPEYDHLIIDEAHQIEDVATQYFGVTVSTQRIEELVRDAEAVWDGHPSPEATSTLRRLRLTAQQFFESFRAKQERYRLRPGQSSPAQQRGYKSLCHGLEQVSRELAAHPSPNESTVAVARRAGEMGLDLDSIVSAADPESVSWCEQRERSVALRSSPIIVGELLRQTLWEPKRSVILTSATLAVDGSFDYIASRLGLMPRDEHILGSPFDFRSQAMLYVPRNLPAPRDPAFVEKAAAEIQRLLHYSGGRAFVLFTSFNNLRAVRLLVEKKLPFPLLVQGEAPRSELLDRFRGTPEAVLFASSSFWEGVDVVGEQLSCVIIDKLPFAVPGDPLVSARIDSVERQGGNGFHDYQVPTAILSLKQGLGRLIRSKKDRGVVAILDSRVANMRYGQRFLQSLPDYRLTHELEDVGSFFRAIAPS